MKKITLVGRGTVGCIAAAHFLRWTDWEIDWIFDPVIKPTAVGEGTTLLLPRSLSTNIDFDGRDMDAINATPKMGIWKRGWGSGKEFYHTFPAGSIGMHFNALKFQEHMFNKIIANRRIKPIESNLSDYENVDSDFVMVCSGSPQNFDGYITRNSIPVNSCLVFQCPWEFNKFNYSITFAKKYGWVFGIPLRNRCAIGYLYNDNFSTSDMIKDDVLDLFSEFNLNPSSVNELKFNNYSREINFTNKVVYNGNASFFLEPLEATSTGFSDSIIRLAYDMWTGKISSQYANNSYNISLDQIESMICLHYFAGSMYESEFWDYAKGIAHDKIYNNFINRTEFAVAIKDSLYNESDYYDNETQGVGSWGLRSYNMNIRGLGINNKLIRLINDYNV